MARAPALLRAACASVAWLGVACFGAACFGLACCGLACPAAHANDADAVKRVTIRAPRDMGYFQGDLVKAEVEIDVADSYAIETASLPHPGPINYWLDLRSIDVASQAHGETRRYALKITYQDFYDALDARQQEIPTFPVTFVDGEKKAVANVPAWQIGVSPLREIAPPPKSDPKDYMRADAPAPYVATDPLWRAAGFAFLAALAALALLARDRAWWPFQARPGRVFADAVRRVRALAGQADDAAYLEALLLVHRGLDQTDGRRVLAEDLPRFLERHPVFAPMREGLATFFAASRRAFFASDPGRARAELDFARLEGFARGLATIERAQP